MSNRRSSRRASKYKTFRELTDADHIYQLNPFNLQIEGLKIKEIKGIEGLENTGKVLIICFRREAITHSPDIEMIPTIKFLFNGDATMQLALIKMEDQPVKFPVPFAASHAYLKEYMGSVEGQLKISRK